MCSPRVWRLLFRAFYGCLAADKKRIKKRGLKFGRDEKEVTFATPNDRSERKGGKGLDKKLIISSLDKMFF